MRIAESSSVGLVLSRSSVLYLPSLLRCVVVATAFYTGFLLVVTALVAVHFVTCLTRHMGGIRTKAG